MPEPPEILSQTATPQTILDRFELLRDHYRMGIMDAGGFNEVLELFQFRDAGGVLWTPGAKSSQWYRWNGREWTPGDPPARLQVPQLMLEQLATSAVKGEPLAPRGPDAPRAVSCPRCGATNVGKKFCTKCGTKLVA